jgi:hypothetical protein
MRLRGRLVPGVSVSFELLSPPPPSPEQVAALAQMQVAAFFYWLTYNTEARSGGFWRGVFRVADCATRSDWGNAVQVEFATAVSAWPARLVAETANGFFQVAIRRDPCAECWAWALEWNANYRVIGYCGEAEAVDNHLLHLPRLEASVIAQTAEGEIRARTEQRLVREDDLLFLYPSTLL